MAVLNFFFNAFACSGVTRVMSNRFSRDDDFLGNGDDLLRSFSSSENDFGKTFAERAMCIDFSKTQIGHGRGLECAENFFRGKFFQREIVLKVGPLRSSSRADNATKEFPGHAVKFKDVSLFLFPILYNGPIAFMFLTRRIFSAFLTSASCAFALSVRGQQAPVVVNTNVTIRVMAANLTSGNFQSYETPGLNILKGLKPDVIAIQEFNYASNSCGIRLPRRSVHGRRTRSERTLFIFGKSGNKISRTESSVAIQSLQTGIWDDRSIAAIANLFGQNLIFPAQRSLCR